MLLTCQRLNPKDIVILKARTGCGANPGFIVECLHLGTFDKPTHDEAIRSRTVAPKNDSPYAAHYGPDALIWSLYLKETEAEDRELVQLWQTGLDSLLVFVSLAIDIL
jgi:hypothetical protein